VKAGDGEFRVSELENGCLKKWAGFRVRIPESIEDMGDAFVNQRTIREVVFAKEINIKQLSGFSGSTLASLEIPRSVEQISLKCFEKCDCLKEVTFVPGAMIKTIGEWAFAESGITSICIPATVEQLEYGCFLECKSLVSVTFEPNIDLKRLDGRAFKSSGLKSFRFPASVEEVGDECFKYCKSLTEVTFEKGSKARLLDVLAFESSGLESFHCPKNIESVSDQCFRECKSLAAVTFERGSKVRILGAYVFECSGLKSFEFPPSVREVLDECFRDCKSLSEVTFVRDVDVSKEAFKGCPAMTIRMPSGAQIESRWEGNSGVKLTEPIDVEWLDGSKIEYYEPKKARTKVDVVRGETTCSPSLCCVLV
jgi:hypothetical protein